MSSVPLRYEFDSLPELVATRGSNKDLDRICLSWGTRISKPTSDSRDPSQVYVSEKAYFVLRHVTRWQTKQPSDGFDEDFDRMMNMSYFVNILLARAYSTKLTKTAICISPWAFTNTQTPKLVCNFTRKRMKEANPDRWPLNVEGFATWTNEVNPKPTKPAQARPGDLLVMPNNINCFTKSDNEDEMTFTLSGWVNNVAGTKYYSLHPIFAQAEADEMQYELNIAARKYADEHSVPLSTVVRSKAFWTTFGQDMCNFHTDRACVAGVLKTVSISRQDYDSLARSNLSTFVPSSDYFNPLEAGPEQLRVDQKWIESEETFPGTVKLQFTPPLSIGPPAQ